MISLVTDSNSDVYPYLLSQISRRHRLLCLTGDQYSKVPPCRASKETGVLSPPVATVVPPHLLMARSVQPPVTVPFCHVSGALQKLLLTAQIYGHTDRVTVVLVLTQQQRVPSSQEPTVIQIA